MQPRSTAAGQDDPLAIHASNSSSPAGWREARGFVSMRHGINKCFSATNPALAMGYEPNPTLFTQAVNGRVGRYRYRSRSLAPRRIGLHCEAGTIDRNDMSKGPVASR